MSRSVAFITTATMGSGKTYARGPYFVVNEWIPFHQGIHVSNFPLDVEAIAEYCERRHGVPKEDTRRRLVVLPQSVVDSWSDELEKGEVPEGPWTYFRENDVPLSGTHIALDEAHIFMPRGERSQIERRKYWRKWLSEIRHEGATVEFLTQDVESLDDQVVKRCDLRMSIISRVSDRDPFLRIPMADWYELKGKFTGEWNPIVGQHELRKTHKGWEEISVKNVELKSEYYRLYDSFSKPQDSKTRGAKGKHTDRHEFEKRSWPSLLWWFFRRNWGALVTRAALVMFLGWATVGGGGTFLIGVLFAFIQGFVPDESGAVKSGPKSEESRQEVYADGLENVEGGSRSGTEGAGEGEELQPLESRFLLPLDTVLYSEDTPDGGFLRYRVSDLAGLLEDNAWLDTTVQVQKQELEQLRVEGSGVSVMTPEYIIFESGERVRVGERIKGSGHYDSELVEIDYRGRRALLDNGAVLTLRLPDVKRSSILGGLSGSGSVSAGSGSGRGSGGGPRGTGDAGRERRPPGAVSPAPGG